MLIVKTLLRCFFFSEFEDVSKRYIVFNVNSVNSADRVHSLSTDAKFSKKLTLLTYVCVSRGVRSVK